MRPKLYAFILFHLAFNLIPVFGVLFRQWTLFSVIYLYWFETLLISFFISLKILYARGNNLQTGVNDVYENTLLYRIKSAFRFLIIRILMLLFYLIFIIAFVGFIASPKDDLYKNFQSVFFQNTTFNLALMIFIVGQTFDFFLVYINQKENLKTHPAQLFSYIDARTVVIHVAIVLGAVGGEKMKNIFPDHHRTAEIFFICIFVFVKSIAEIISLTMKRK